MNCTNNNSDVEMKKGKLSEKKKKESLLNSY